MMENQLSWCTVFLIHLEDSWHIYKIISVMGAYGDSVVRAFKCFPQYNPNLDSWELLYYRWSLSLKENESRMVNLGRDNFFWISRTGSSWGEILFLRCLMRLMPSLSMCIFLTVTLPIPGRQTKWSSSQYLPSFDLFLVDPRWGRSLLCRAFVCVSTLVCIVHHNLRD